MSGASAKVHPTPKYPFFNRFIASQRQGGFAMKQLSMGIGLVSFAYLLVLWVMYRGRIVRRMLKRYATALSRRVKCIRLRHIPFTEKAYARLDDCRLKTA